MEYEFKPHFHCEICSESYDSREDAYKCFMSHSELDILRYIAYSIFCSKFFAKNSQKPQTVDWNVWHDIDEINRKFGFAKKL